MQTTFAICVGFGIGAAFSAYVSRLWGSAPVSTIVSFLIAAAIPGAMLVLMLTHP